MAATILICTPIFLPLAHTPPVGSTQFVGCAIGGLSVGEVMRPIWPFYGALIAALMLATCVPAPATSSFCCRRR